MTHIQRWTSVLLAVTVLSSGGAAWAQATFSVSSTASTVIRTGHAEPLGALTFSVIFGTTDAEIIPIDLSPAVLTSDDVVISTSGIQATGFSAMVDPDAGQVRLHVPAGVGPGTLVHLEGLRISVPASGIETLDARISTIKNRLTASSRAAQVIARAAAAIVIDPSTDSVFTYSSGGVLIDPLGHFIFSEGFAGAFSDGTEIIFQASALPRNTQLRFPATIESQTGARLRTAPVEDVTLASGAARNRGAYTFETDNGPSPTVVDVFSFRPVLERTGSVGAGTGFYQVTIGPIGAAEPTRALPSTAVPRYDELLLPALPALPTSKTFLFPVEPGVEAQSFTVSNTADGVAPLTIRAFGEAGDLLEGPDVANERAHLLGARQTLTFDLRAMFGTSATPETVASVAIESKNDRPVATTIGATPGGAYALHSQTPVAPAYFPFDRRNPGEMPLVSVVGAGAADFESRWTLMDTAGVEQASAVREASAGGAVRDSLDALFDIDAAAVPLAGYVRVESMEAQFRGHLVDNPGEGTHAMSAVLAHGDQPIHVPLLRHRRGIQHRRHVDQYLGAGGGRDSDRIRCRRSGSRPRVHAPDAAPGHGDAGLDGDSWSRRRPAPRVFQVGCQTRLLAAPVRQHAATDGNCPHRGTGQPGGGAVLERARRRVLLHAGPLRRGGIHGPVDPQRWDRGYGCPHRGLRGGRRATGYGRARGGRGGHPDRAATGVAAGSGFGRWGLPARGVVVDPDVDARRAGPDGWHRAAAPGRADGALASCAECLNRSHAPMRAGGSRYRHRGRRVIAKGTARDP